MDQERRTIPMRAACRGCSCDLGVVREVSGQDTVRCSACDRFAYNAPRVETGRAQRSVTTVHNGIKPKQRSRILERASKRCEVCGNAGNLHVGHILSVDAGLAYGVTEELLNDDENLICQCEECNLGQGATPMSLRLAVVILRCRVTHRDGAKA